MKCFSRLDFCYILLDACKFLKDIIYKINKEGYPWTGDMRHGREKYFR